MQEAGVSEPVLGLAFSQEGVGENDPYFFYLAGSKIFCYLPDVDAQKGDIGQAFGQGSFGAGIDTVALDVNADEIPAFMFLAEVDAVFALAAGELERDGMIVPEKGIPVALHVFGVLEHIAESINSLEA